VLFSYIHRRWKIADFGFTTEGSSDRLKLTDFGRGTSAYRAPELLQEIGGYHSKSDIWAFGCIAYELFTGKKAFLSDWDVKVYEYPKLIIDWDQKFPKDLDEKIHLVYDALKIYVNSIHPEWEKRKSAKELRELISELGLSSCFSSKT
jgi:serine/threonine protein kinase